MIVFDWLKNIGKETFKLLQKNVKSYKFYDKVMPASFQIFRKKDKILFKTLKIKNNLQLLILQTQILNKSKK